MLFEMSMLFLKYQYAYFLFENKRFSMLFENEVSINVLFSYIYKFSVSILYFKYEIWLHFEQISAIYYVKNEKNTENQLH